MILYHTGNCEIEMPDIHHGRKNAVVNIYEFDEKELEAYEKEFSERIGGL